jgi:hypothetical protein
MQVRHPLEIYTVKWNKAKEANVGADWDWFMLSGPAWLAFRVQAKKLDAKSMMYPELDRIKNRGLRQSDLLIRSSAKSSHKPHTLVRVLQLLAQ